MAGDHSRALRCFDDLMVLCPWFQHSLGEKALLLAKMNSWEQSSEAVTRALAECPGDMEALRVQILILLSRDGRPCEASLRIRELFEILKSTEPNNAALFYGVAKRVARISDGHLEVLAATTELMRHAVKLDSTRGAFNAEMVYHYALLGDFEGAMKHHKQVSKLEEPNKTALYGIIYAHIKLRKFEDASQQLELLSVVQDSEINSSASFNYLYALLSWELEHDRAKQVRLLQKAAQLCLNMFNRVDSHIANASSLADLSQSNPLFLYEIAFELLQSDRMMQTNTPRKRVDTKLLIAGESEGITILEKLVQQFPGFLRTQFTLAHAYFDANRLDDAYRVCRQILEMESSNAPTRLLQSRVNLEREHFHEAAANLEQALCLNFAIRQSPVYWITKARISKSSNNPQDARRELQTSLQLVSNPKLSPNCHRRLDQVLLPRSTTPISLADHASVYIHAAQMLSQLGNAPEADTTIKMALEKFHGTSQEARVLLAMSKLAAERSDYEAALTLLNRVSMNSPAFVEATVVKAEIFLTHLKDEKQYVQCFQELVELTPHDATAHVQLAEAYVRLRMLDQAAEVLSTAATLGIANPLLVGRIGRVFIAKHDYTGAVNFYESALHMSPDNPVLRKDLVQLYANLSRFNDALRIAQEISYPSQSVQTEEVDHLLQLQELLLVLPSVHRGLGSDELALQKLLEVYDLQKLVLDRLHHERPDGLRAQQAAISDTCFQIANTYALSPVGRADVIKYCELALRTDETHESALLLLARTHQQAGEVDQCRIRCMALMKLNPAHVEAALLLSELIAQDEDYDMAVDILQRLLINQPGNFAVLSRLLVVLRKAGKLHGKEQRHHGSELAKHYLLLASRSSIGRSPGLHFCRGLLARFFNRLDEAIDEFNQARHDSEWGQRALVNIIEIYLFPMGVRFGDVSDMETVLTGNSEALEVVDALLEELRQCVSGDNGQSGNKLKFRVLEAYSTMAERTKHMVQLGSHRLLELLQTMGRDYVPALLGLALGYLLTQQESKARNQLKRIAKLPYDLTLADDFELSYLLLAGLYLSREKFDLAQDLSRRALKHNQSCVEAWEILGLILEKEQAFIDAAECYEKAWVYHGEASAEIGFKLAFNYLKAKKLVAAVDVCHKVLDQYPDYPKIRTEILDKAYAAFRP